MLELEDQARCTRPGRQHGCRSRRRARPRPRHRQHRRAQADPACSSSGRSPYPTLPPLEIRDTASRRSVRGQVTSTSRRRTPASTRPKASVRPRAPTSTSSTARSSRTTRRRSTSTSSRPASSTTSRTTRQRPVRTRSRCQQTQLFDERIGQGKLITTYRVVPTGNFRSVPNPPNPAPGVSDTGRGLYLVSIRFIGTDDRGQAVRVEVRPVQPAAAHAVPVVQGTGPINASGTDPQTGTQVTITGVVKGKKQVDACGDRVDTWLVDAVESYRFTTRTRCRRRRSKPTTTTASRRSSAA